MISPSMPKMEKHILLLFAEEHVSNKSRTCKLLLSLIFAQFANAMFKNSSALVCPCSTDTTKICLTDQICSASSLGC